MMNFIRVGKHSEQGVIMVYLVRFLDINGQLKKERIMFHAVRILDSNGKLKKVIKSKLLSRRHWKEFPCYLKTKRKGKNNFNAHSKAKSSCISIGVECS